MACVCGRGEDGRAKENFAGFVGGDDCPTGVSKRRFKESFTKCAPNAVHTGLMLQT